MSLRQVSLTVCVDNSFHTPPKVDVLDVYFSIISLLPRLGALYCVGNTLIRV